MKKIIVCALSLILINMMSCSIKEDIIYDLLIKPENRLYSETPVSPLLYSQFIEIGFGYQIAPMQAERFFNRSFEEFPFYNGKSKNSFGFLLPDNKYIKDWSGESWYHTGYEHDSWYAAPGKPEDPAWITNESTHFVTTSESVNVILELVEGGCGHGQQSIRIINNEDEVWGGLAQDGKWMEEGKVYSFSGFLRQEGRKAGKQVLGQESRKAGKQEGGQEGRKAGKQEVGNKDGELRVKVLILREGEWEEKLFEKEIEINGEFEKYEFEIPYDGPTAQMTFALFIPPGCSVEADAFSLMPEDHYYKWKPETVETVKKLNPGLIRFPGGCFASFYDWRKGVGPFENRQPEPSYFWGGLNNNDLGTAEFAMLCKEVGCEMMVCINMYHPNKEKYLRVSRNPWQDLDYDLPQFTDIDKGIKDACDWLAYCNLKEGEHPMADLRASHGYREPFGVKYWEMDNETVRWMSPQDYAALCVRYSKEMKALDPGIKIGMLTYDFTDHVPDMLEIAGRDIDFFADRDDFEDGRLNRMIDWLNAYNKEHGTNIKYCNTEWQVHPYGAANPKEEVDERFLYGHKTKIKRAMVLGTWYCGLKAAGYLMDWQRRGSIVDFVNYNNFSNTHGQAVIETPKAGAYLTAPGKLYELISRTPAKWPLTCENYSPQRTEMLQAQAAFTMQKDSLVLYGLNRTDSVKYIEFDLTGFDVKFQSVDYSMLEADDIMARTKIDLPDEIKRTDWRERHRGKTLIMECPPRSFTQAVLHDGKKL